MAVFVLEHGSWHDGAAWEGVIRHLEGKGHKAFAPTAIGYEKGANKKVTHAQCVKSIVNFVNAKSLSDFTVAGQSKIRERFSVNKVHDGLHALRMRDFLVGPFFVTNRRRSERLVPFAFEVTNHPFPRGSVMPGTMLQNEHCHCCLSQERSDA